MRDITIIRLKKTHSPLLPAWDDFCQLQNIPTFLETTQLATREMLRNKHS